MIGELVLYLGSTLKRHSGRYYGAAGPFIEELIRSKGNASKSPRLPS